MPANLNALIRYKTIDQCLGRKYAQYTIAQLQDVCSEALGEFCGIYKKVSERTIRDDIRVMRSDILSFNAPIICEGGYYSYSDPGYSIFRTSIKDLGLLKQVMEILLVNRSQLIEKGIDEIISKLGTLIAEPSYDDYPEYLLKKSRIPNYPPSDPQKEELFTEEPVCESRAQSAEPDMASRFVKRIKRRKKMKEAFKDTFLFPETDSHTIHSMISPSRIEIAWGDILKLVG